MNIDAKLTPQQNESLQEIMRRTMELVCIKSGIARTCLSCCHFNEAAESCTYYNPPMRPPARVIVEGCSAWSETPF